MSVYQSAFVPDRQILDNVIVAHEAIHHLNKKKSGKDGFLAIKLDMSKTYDRVEWIFLLKVVQHMGICPKWINRILTCLSTVRYSFNLNGENKGLIRPTRGIRQGGLLSPYFFLICAEGLTSLLKKAEMQGKIHGLKIVPNSHSISHLLFANDSLIFCKAKKEEAKEVMRILEIYGKVSGQIINSEKSLVFFSKNMKQEDCIQVTALLNNMN